MMFSFEITFNKKRLKAEKNVLIKIHINMICLLINSVINSTSKYDFDNELFRLKLS